MNSLIFTNPGVIDPVAMMTFGVSAKTKDTAIGMFGTGLKYAIAVLLRNGYHIDIYAGDKLYKFTTEVYTTREQDFNLVYLNGESAHFTTELGKFWEPWMAGRELVSNALDEGGKYFMADSWIKDPTGTVIIVHGRDVFSLYGELAKVFINTQPIVKGSWVDIHAGESDWVYYRGIRAMKLENPSMYTYNILSELTLTEDRTIKYAWDANSQIAYEVNALQDRHMMTRIVSARQDTMERGIHYNIDPSDLLKEIVTELMSNLIHVPNSLKILCKLSIIDILSNRAPMELDVIDTARLKKAIAFAKKINFQVDDYPIILTQHLGEQVLGMAIDRKIYISDRVLHMGTKMLVGTLIEEYLHISEGVDDCSRGMQNLLFDTICSLGERIIGEPL